MREKNVFHEYYSAIFHAISETIFTLNDNVIPFNVLFQQCSVGRFNEITITRPVIYN